MQTFLPYNDFALSAKVLDMRRLGKQRVETLQILNALLVPGKGWSNHPAVKMWRGHENSLVEYGKAITEEWLARGYKDTCLAKISSFFSNERRPDKPAWCGNYDFHIAHQSNLIRKMPEHYEKLFPGIPNDLPYIWPIQ